MLEFKGKTPGHCLILLLSCLVTAASTTVCAAEVFRTVDKNGNVVFSDTSSEGAKTVEIEEPMTFKAADYVDPYNTGTSGVNDDAKSNQTYELAITTPQNEQTIRDNTGSLTISWQMTPALAIGDVAELLMDGERIEPVYRSGSTELTNVDRGTHTIELKIMRRGKLVETTGPIVVHLHRASIGGR